LISSGEHHSNTAVESASGLRLAGLLYGLGLACLLDDPGKSERRAVQRLRCPSDCDFSYWSCGDSHSEACDHKSDEEFALHDDGWAG